MNIDFYIDQAKQKSNSSSDRELAKRLNVTHVAVSNWRTRRVWPSDENMMALSEMAGLSPSQGLIELNIWRTGSPGARRYYEAMLKNVAAIFIAALVLSNLLPASSPYARPFGEQIAGKDLRSIYYTMFA